MSTPWHDLLAASAVRANAIAGSQAATLETNYATRPLTTTQFKSAVFPFTSHKQTLQMAEERLVHVIANSNNPMRSYLAGVTSGLAAGSALPSLSSANKQIIGLWGNVYDASDGTALDEKSLVKIRRANSNSNAWRKSSVYWFKIIGQRIHHTRANVVIDVCVYDASTQKTAIGNNSNMLLPDVLAPALVCGALALLLRDSQFAEQAGSFAALFTAQEEAIRQGSVNDVTHLPVTMAA